ncbi:uncharacterized protein STEHIDRAFT_110564 [Stereum hirsutum FP-91666 SS1]|uniref:uncharacterized protein n=1 Tax=Stereum hirsutum (strain FP-91666) TaxID=721885 RepID=UPI000440CBE7|nr:uncharacterized protein STEHIDRAFT_110564 [Stereum hirsutum FP-91666 SS1]EIM87328.1 hypothetical protein STEHIDRAFT_110564 [Stereum hirsutum FP-91666 SS1]
MSNPPRRLRTRTAEFTDHFLRRRDEPAPPMPAIVQPEAPYAQSGKSKRSLPSFLGFASKRKSYNPPRDSQDSYPSFAEPSSPRNPAGLSSLLGPEIISSSNPNSVDIPRSSRGSTSTAPSFTKLSSPSLVPGRSPALSSPLKRRSSPPKVSPTEESQTFHTPPSSPSKSSSARLPPSPSRTTSNRSSKEHTTSSRPVITVSSSGSSTEHAQDAHDESLFTCPRTPPAPPKQTSRAPSFSSTSRPHRQADANSFPGPSRTSDSSPSSSLRRNPSSTSQKASPSPPSGLPTRSPSRLVSSRSTPQNGSIARNRPAAQQPSRPQHMRAISSDAGAELAFLDGPFDPSPSSGLSNTRPSSPSNTSQELEDILELTSFTTPFDFPPREESPTLASEPEIPARTSSLARASPVATLGSVKPRCTVAHANKTRRVEKFSFHRKSTGVTRPGLPRNLSSSSLARSRPTASAIPPASAPPVGPLPSAPSRSHSPLVNKSPAMSSLSRTTSTSGSSTRSLALSLSALSHRSGADSTRTLANSNSKSDPASAKKISRSPSGKGLSSMPSSSSLGATSSIASSRTLVSTSGSTSRSLSTAGSLPGHMPEIDDMPSVPSMASVPARKMSGARAASRVRAITAPSQPLHIQTGQPSSQTPPSSGSSGQTMTTPTFVRPKDEKDKEKIKKSASQLTPVSSLFSISPRSTTSASSPTPTSTSPPSSLSPVLRNANIRTSTTTGVSKRIASLSSASESESSSSQFPPVALPLAVRLRIATDKNDALEKRNRILEKENSTLAEEKEVLAARVMELEKAARRKEGELRGLRWLIVNGPQGLDKSENQFLSVPGDGGGLELSVALDGLDGSMTSTTESPSPSASLLGGATGSDAKWGSSSSPGSTQDSGVYSKLFGRGNSDEEAFEGIGEAEGESGGGEMEVNVTMTRPLPVTLSRRTSRVSLSSRSSDKEKDRGRNRSTSQVSGMTMGSSISGLGIDVSGSESPSMLGYHLPRLGESSPSPSRARTPVSPSASELSFTLAAIAEIDAQTDPQTEFLSDAMDEAERDREWMTQFEEEELRRREKDERRASKALKRLSNSAVLNGGEAVEAAVVSSEHSSHGLDWKRRPSIAQVMESDREMEVGMEEALGKLRVFGGYASDSYSS